MTRNDKETNGSMMGAVGLHAPAEGSHLAIDRSPGFRLSAAMVSTAAVWPSTASHAEDHGPWLHLTGFNCTHVLSAN